MRYFAWITAILVGLAAASAAQAQITLPRGNVWAKSAYSEAPVCTYILNTAPYKVYGKFDTDIQMLEDGTQAHFSQNFALETNERADICAKGPFFEGQRLELTLRTLIPTFVCRTKIDAPLTITGQVLSDGSTKSHVDCR